MTAEYDPIASDRRHALATLRGAITVEEDESFDSPRDEDLTNIIRILHRELLSRGASQTDIETAVRNHYQPPNVHPDFKGIA